MGDSQAVIVLGMHRSGTSALAGLLAELGIAMGRKLFKAQSGVNDKGFYENAEVVKLNEWILDSLPAAWDQPMSIDLGALAVDPLLAEACLRVLQRDYDGESLWGIKDPRLCLTLPCWKPAIDATAGKRLFLLSVRQPGEVAASLMRRDGFSREKCAYIWLNYTLAAWDGTRGEPRRVVTYEALIEDPLRVVDELRERLKLPQSHLRAPVSVDGSLRRNRDSQWGESALERLSMRVYQELTSSGDIDDSALEECLAEYRAHQACLPMALIEHALGVQRSEVHYRRHFEAAYYSWWWKLARPLKKLEERLRRRDIGPVSLDQLKRQPSED